MSTYKFELADRSITFGTPIRGVWYAGINHLGEVGAVARYDGEVFVNSEGEVGMHFYQFLRRVVRPALPAGPVPNALRWLETLINSPVVPWAEGQKEAALAALLEAKASLT